MKCTIGEISNPIQRDSNCLALPRDLFPSALVPSVRTENENGSLVCVSENELYEFVELTNLCNLENRGVKGSDIRANAAQRYHVKGWRPELNIMNRVKSFAFPASTVSKQNFHLITREERERRREILRIVRANVRGLFPVLNWSDARYVFLRVDHSIRVRLSVTFSVTKMR